MRPRHEVLHLRLLSLPLCLLLPPFLSPFSLSFPFASLPPISSAMPSTRSSAQSPRTRHSDLSSSSSPSSSRTPPTSSSRKKAKSSSSSRPSSSSSSRSSHRKSKANPEPADDDEDEDDATPDTPPSAPSSKSSRASKRKRSSTRSASSKSSKRSHALLQVKVDEATSLPSSPSHPPAPPPSDASHPLDSPYPDHPSTPARLPPTSQPSPAYLGSSFLHPLASPFPWSSAMSPLPHPGGLPAPAPTPTAPSSAPTPHFRVPVTPMSLNSSSLDLLSPSTQGGYGGEEGGAIPLSTPQLFKSPQKFTFVTPATARPDTASSTSSASSSSATTSPSQRPSYVQRLDFSTPEVERGRGKDKGGEGDIHHLRPAHLPLLSPGGFASPTSSRFYGADLLSPSPYHPVMSSLSPFITPSRLDTSTASSSGTTSSLNTPAGHRAPSPTLFSPAPASAPHGGFPFSPMFPASPSTSSLMFSPSSSFPSPSPLNAASGGSAMVYQSGFLSLPTPHGVGGAAMLLNSPSSSLLSPASFTSSPTSYSSSASSSSPSLNGSPLHPSLVAASSSSSPPPVVRSPAGQAAHTHRHSRPSPLPLLPTAPYSALVGHLGLGRVVELSSGWWWR